MKKTFTAFWDFLKRPSLLRLSDHKATLKQDFLWLLLLDIVVAFALAVTFSVLVKFNFIDEYKEQDLIKEYGVYLSFLLLCVFAPLVEECFFRWHLTKRYATVYFLFFSLSGIIISFVSENLIGYIVFFLLLIISISAHQYLKKQSQTKKQLIWKKMFQFIFYFSAIIFGIIHLSNFDGLTIKDPAFIIYISSQMFGGLSLGYLRIKHGLKYSMLSHACFNLVVLTLSILFPNF